MATVVDREYLSDQRSGGRGIFGSILGRGKAIVLSRLNEGLVGAVLLALVIIFWLLSPDFMTKSNVRTIFDSVAVIGVLSVGQAFVIITAGIDLSQGAIVALAGVISGYYMAPSGGSVFLGVMVGLAVGLGVGLLNGLIVAYTRVPAFIVTLATLLICGGGALLFTSGAPLANLLPSVGRFGFSYVWVLPYLFFITLGVMLIGALVLNKTKYGRYVYAIGSNLRAAKLAGLRTRGILVSVYVISAVLSAIGGMMLMAYVNEATPTAGANFELDAIAAVVIGGGSLFGGQGSAITAVVGALLLGVLSNGTEILGVSSYMEQLLLGVVVVASVFVDSYRRRRAV